MSDNANYSEQNKGLRKGLRKMAERAPQNLDDAHIQAIGRSALSLADAFTDHELLALIAAILQRMERR